MSPNRPTPNGRFAAASDALQKGQALEARGDATSIQEAIARYDQAIAAMSENPIRTSEADWQLALGWMNRGNALQKLAGSENLHQSVAAYDHAIGYFEKITPRTPATHANSLGAAWLNRSHALHELGKSHHDEAMKSCQQAVSILETLPHQTHLVGRLNLAGAKLNLAHLLIDSPDENRLIRAYTATGDALNLAAEHELERAAFAEIGLKSRRILCEIIGQWLIETHDPQRQQQLIATASDAVDTGLTLARRWASSDDTAFRSLAVRLFRFGTAFYRRHQPHFLADFVLENIDPEHTSDAYREHPEFHAIARDSLTASLLDLRSQFPVVAQDPSSDRRLQTVHAIQSALNRLSELPPSFP